MRLAALFALLLAAACAAPAGPKQYLLAAPEAAAPVAALPPVGLREIALPLYARRPQIASLDAEGAVIASDDHRWAEDQPHAATRLIARRLARLGGGEVYAEPWPQTAAPQVIVSVEVDRFIGAPGGVVTLDGAIVATRAGARGRPETTPFLIETPVAGDDTSALTAAYGAALAMLADRVAELLASR